MQVDKTLFTIHTLELNYAIVLLRPEQAEGAQEKNVVIGDPRPMIANDKILAKEIIAQKTPDGKNDSEDHSQCSQTREARKFHQSACCPGATGQTGITYQSDRSDRSDQTQQPVRPVQSSAPDFQAKASGSGYLEDKQAKRAGTICKSETYLCGVIEQVHKGRSTRSAIKKETTITTMSR
jgi:hypothetical protein